MQEQVRILLENWNLHSAASNLILVAGAVVIGLILKLIFSVVVRRNADTNDKFVLFQSLLRPVERIYSVVFNFLLQVMRLSPAFLYRLNRAIEIGLIISFAWLLIEAIKVMEDFIHYPV